jgi:hypothetical protein
MAQEAKTPAGPLPQRGVADRRTLPRYTFTADAEIVEEISGKRIEARIADISQRGCQAETSNPLPLGTQASIRITKGSESFETRGRVVYSSPSSLGIAFSDIQPAQAAVLESWLGLSRERDWLTLNRRRTQRVLVRVPIRVSAQSGSASQFQEQTHTLAISAHGASIQLLRPVARGEKLELLNIATGDRAECIVAHLGQRHGDSLEVGIEFLLPNPNFWHVAFPPKDWTQPLTNS